MAGNLQPLDQKFPVVKPDGTPTDYFIRWAQQRQVDIGTAITEQDLLDYLVAHELQAGSGIGLTPGGNLSDSPTIAAKVQEILDQISTTEGSILYRSATGWAALAPGTSGNFLKTNGASADPTWAAASGGGSYLGSYPLALNISPGALNANFFWGRTLISDRTGHIDATCWWLTAAAASTIHFTPAVYDCSSGHPTTLLGSGPTVLGHAAGIAEFPLTSPVAVIKGQGLVAGFIVTGGTPSGAGCDGNGAAPFAVTSDTPPSTAPAELTGARGNASMFARYA